MRDEGGVHAAVARLPLSFLPSQLAAFFIPHPSSLIPSEAAPAQQVAQDRLGRIVQRFDLAHVVPLFEDQRRQLLEELTRVARRTTRPPSSGSSTPTTSASATRAPASRRGWSHSNRTDSGWSSIRSRICVRPCPRPRSAAGHDGDVVGELFQLLQLVAGHEQAFAAGGQRPEQVQQSGRPTGSMPPIGSSSTSRAGSGSSAWASFDPLPHPLRIPADPPVGRGSAHPDLFNYCRRYGEHIAAG